MTVVIAILAALALAVLVLRALRWVRDDGGPLPAPPRRYEDEWSPDPPSSPYIQRIHP